MRSLTDIKHEIDRLSDKRADVLHRLAAGHDPELIAEVQAAVDDANKAVSRAESIRKFRILSSDFTEASGHLTPSLKVKRSVVMKDFAAEIEILYAPG